MRDSNFPDRAAARTNNPVRLKHPDLKYIFFLYIFLILFSTQSLCQDLQQKITLKVSDKSISEVLKEISRLSDIDFSYNPVMVPVDKRISVHARNKTVAEILDVVLTSQGIDYLQVEIVFTDM